MRLLIALVYIFIAYGSLFPFDFSAIELEQKYLGLLNASVSGWRNVATNVLLFIPLGALYYLTFQQEGKLTNRRYKISLWCSVFSFALILQILQIALPGRDQNFLDAILNIVGFSIAYFLARYIYIPRNIYTPKLSYLPLVIALTYLVSELSPFFPTLDFQEFKNAIKPLLELPTSDIIPEVFLTFTMWLLVIRLISFPKNNVPLKLLLPLWLTMIGGKILIYNNHLSYIDFIAPALALLITLFINLGNTKVTRVILVFSLCIFTLSSVSSLGLSNISYTAFIPFYTYLIGNPFIAIQGFLFKLFFFSAILWLALELSISLKKMGIFLIWITTVIELSQLFMPTRVTDFGDAFIALFAYLLVRNIGDFLAEQEEKNALGKANSFENTSLNHEKLAFTPSLQFLAYCSAVFFIFYLSVNLLLTIPGMPDNIHELLESGGSFFDLLFFFIFLHAVGGASYYIYIRSQAYSTFEGIKILGLHLLTLTVLFTLLWLAVDDESIKDIIGASTLKQALYANQTSQQDFMLLVQVFGLSTLANVTEFFDFLFRFGALFGLVQIPLTFWLMCFRPTIVINRLIIKGILSVLLIFACYHVVFNFAITDNITELIAQPFILILLLTGLTLAIAFTVKQMSKHRYLLALSTTIITALLTWLLTPLAFEQAIVKYGYTFSALDFLIGAGRDELIGNEILMVRWAVLTIAFQWLMVGGCLFFRKWYPIAFPGAMDKTQAL